MQMTADDSETQNDIAFNLDGNRSKSDTYIEVGPDPLIHNDNEQIKHFHSMFIVNDFNAPGTGAVFLMDLM